MRGMILAAGRGERMGELTMKTPKPLLRIGDRYLIEHSIDSLIQAGIKDIVINICYLRDQIKAALGDGTRYGVTLHYSEEKEALETGGGIYQALPLLGSEPFIVLSCDIVTDFPLVQLPKEPKGLAHLVLVSNPSYHQKGDFCLVDDEVRCGEGGTFTFSNIGVYRPELFAGSKAGRFRLGNLLKETIVQKKVTGEVYQGRWHNVGTQDELRKVVTEAALNPILSHKRAFVV